MNIFENGQLEPTPGLVSAEARRKGIEANLLASRERRVKQLDLVQSAAKAVNKLMAARLWERCTVPEEVRDAKRKYKSASENFEDEKDMLQAIDIAIKNSTAEMAAASGEVQRAIKGIISRVARETEKEILAKVEEAMADYVASQLAIHGPGAVPGAQYDLEMMTSDIRRLKAIDARIGAAYKKLEEAAR